MLSAGIHLDGLAQLRRDLKKIDPELTKGLRIDFLLIGKEIAAEAAAKVPTGKTGQARRSIRAGVSGNTAYVAGGKATVPYYGWLDFGSRNPISGRPLSVGPWRGSGGGPRRGRFLYPTIEQNKPKILRRATEAFDKASDAVLKKSY